MAPGKPFEWLALFPVEPHEFSARGPPMKKLACLLAVLTLCLPGPAAPPEPRVSDTLAPTMQVLKPAGKNVTFNGRPVDLVVAPNGKHVYVKDNRGLVVIESKSWKVIQELPTKGGGGSEHGIVLSRDGKRLYLGNVSDKVFEGAVGNDGKVK
jgi:hypothetical protein